MAACSFFNAILSTEASYIVTKYHKKTISEKENIVFRR